ncbi:Carboxypeptidase regulatory-like domain-containing protein [Bryocella elongata]|uniref:Carboxypeptidase regulatory-like domain-containing protein n=1 Tax=Bryocella elongata TaxID=863522 RepID=A0A1H5YCJ8_9BACT|nr:carboxypeptidase-like regulatory domain-containing protein [Bryocella elongata]SEG21492.1 Carboxypeptidase regulatory-like domain-containing protein [Bryocella elongata]
MEHLLRPARIFALTSLVICCLDCPAQRLVSTSIDSLSDSPGFLLQAAQEAEPAPNKAGVISGVVTDGHGGVIPAAKVTLSEQGHAGLLETASDSTGRFRFRGLDAGSYTLLISAPQFRTLLTPSVELRAGEHSEVPPVTLVPTAESESITVSANSSAVAEQELKIESQQRIIGLLPNFYTSFVYDAAPMNTRQKFKLNLRSVTDPVIILEVAATAGAEQYRNTFPSWGNDDAESYGKRFGAALGDELLRHTFSNALYPSIFHQDPRYFYMGPTNKTSTRIWHALESGIITRGDNGHQQLNYSHLLGSASAGAVSSLYHPRSDSAGYLAGLNVGIGIGTNAFQALLREFLWPHLTTHVPAYATGRTAQTHPDTP